MATNSDWIFSSVFFVFVFIYCSDANSSRRQIVQRQHRPEQRINKYNGWQDNKEDDMFYTDDFSPPEYKERRDPKQHSKRYTIRTNRKRIGRNYPETRVTNNIAPQGSLDGVAAKQTLNAPLNTNAMYKRTDQQTNKYNGWQDNNEDEDYMSYDDEFFPPEYKGRRESKHHSKRHTKEVHKNREQNNRNSPETRVTNNIASQKDNDKAFNRLTGKQTGTAPQNTNVQKPDSKVTTGKPLIVQQPNPPKSKPEAKQPSDGKKVDEKKEISSIKSLLSALKNKTKDTIAYLTRWIKDAKSSRKKQSKAKPKTSPTLKPKASVKPNASPNNNVPVKPNASPSANNRAQTKHNTSGSQKGKGSAPSNGKNIASNHNAPQLKNQNLPGTAQRN